MDKIDTEALLRSVNIVDVVGRRVSLKKEGAEHVGLCPFHDDHRGSLKVNERKQIYKCFACDAGGDALDFLQRGGQSFHEAVAELQGKHGHFAPPAPLPSEPKQTATIIQPVPADAPEPSSKKKLQTDRGEEWGRFIKRWAYRDERGQLLGYTARFEDNAGKKQVFPQVYVEKEGKRYWSWKGFPTPRPLYGLYDLAKAKPDATVLIVEGEKTADAAAKLFPHVSAVTWMGGAQGIKHANWQPLAGRKILIWPDNDAPGCEAASAIAELLQPICPVVKFIQPPAGPKGWDVADASWTTEEATAYAKANVTATVPVPTHPVEPEPAAMFAAPINPVPTAPEPEQIERPFFRFLGFEKASGTLIHAFYQDATKLVIKATAGSINKSLMYQLVPDPTWWATNFPSKKGFDQDNAQTWMINRSHMIGMFDPDKVRGRGAWMDRRRVVMHLGDTLVVDGQPVPLDRIETRYTYEQSPRMAFGQSEPATTDETSKMFNVLNMINWERPASAPLLAGWCVVAPMCGALHWRPHIWITGGSGTGKSWVMNNIVKTLLGDTALDTQGDTSEAGLRQTLGMDALPVVFDEADIDEQKDGERIQKVLALMRSSSTNEGGDIIKGTATGQSKKFKPRSCFALGSIAVQATKQADKSRITVLAIRRELDKERAKANFEQLEKAYAELFTRDFVTRLQSRTTRMLPTILRNARMCSDAVAELFGNRRTGDQLGILISGALSLVGDGLVSLDDAKRFILRHDWTDERGLDEQRDELKLLQYLLEQTVIVDGAFGKMTRAIGEILRVAVGLELRDNDLSAELAGKTLNRMGFRVDYAIMATPQTFAVSNDHDWIRQRLRNTAWAQGWNKILMRLEGAKAAEKPLRFSGGVVSRAVEIPVSFIS